MIHLHDQRLIDAVLKTCDPNRMSLDLPRRLAQVATVGESVKRLESARSEVVSRLNAELRRYDELLKSTRDSCGHLVTTYYGDPAGGSDSHSVCDICGAYV